MNKKNLELLNLEDGCTAEQVNEAYEKLRIKYGEERFSEGEKGNEAARMLTKIGVARDELLAEIAESQNFDPNASGEVSAYARVEELLRAGDVQEAQRVLDQFNERGAHWHYLQSVVFYRKNWINESKKQLEIAMHLDAENEKYKEAYKRLNEKISSDQTNRENTQTVYNGQTMNSYSDDQMGGNFCTSCIECCALNMCINCMCNGCCR